MYNLNDVQKWNTYKESTKEDNTKALHDADWGISVKLSAAAMALYSGEKQI